MKAPVIVKWPNELKPYYGLLLFAQLWDEMLFDYTLDSYQPRRFNILGLCSELIDAYETFESDILSVRSITPIRDELVYVLKGDHITKLILGDELPVLQKVLEEWDPAKPQKTLSFAAESIFKQVEPILQNNITEALIESTKDANKKKEIIDLSGRLLTEILRKGYSPNFVYFSLQNYFFRNHPISGVNDLSTFLKLFDGTDRKYEVIFKLGPEGIILTRNTDPKYIRLSDKVEPKLPHLRIEAPFLEKKPEEVFIIAPEIDAKDEFSARREAEDRLEIISTLVGFWKHGIQITPEMDALVYEGSPATRVYQIKPPIRPTFKRSDLPSDEALDEAIKESANALISDKLDQKTIYRLAGAVRAHIVGVHASISENQFSNLWTALETISSTSPDKNTISLMLERLVPILSSKYFLKLIHELHRDLKKCVYPALEKCLSQRIGDERDIESLVRILSQTECKQYREILYAACENNPLLRFRISQFNEILTSPKTALNLLSEHENRVRWHLQRFYRARNMVIHSGVEYELIDLLIENLHDYFDHVFSEIIIRINEDPNKTSIDKIYAQYNWEYAAYKNALSNITDEGGSLKAAKIIVFGMRSK